MGLFGWHRCGEPGCKEKLFAPMFDAEEHGAPADGDYWKKYLVEREKWHLIDERQWSDPVAVASERCPIHKVRGETTEGCHASDAVGLL